MLLTLLVTLMLVLQAPGSTLQPDPPMRCAACDAWNEPLPPFKVFGNTYFVGTGGLSSVLITSDSGHILLDGGLTQSAALIDANIRQLGFDPADIRLIAASHEHYDHVGGIAALQRLSGAEVVHSEAGVRALRRGLPNDDDPQIAFGREANAFPAVSSVRAVADGEVVRVGPLAITAHYTPGHTPGSTSWSWRSCEGDRCVDIVYADSLNPVSSDDFRFSGGNGRPGIEDSFRASIAKVASLPCDIVISVHPGFTNLTQKLAARAAGASPDPFIDGGCGQYAADAARRLDERLARERR